MSDDTPPQFAVNVRVWTLPDELRERVGVEA